MLVLGRITAPFGVQGWVHIHPFADDPQSWAAMANWWLCKTADAADAEWRSNELDKARLHGDGLVAKFAGVDDRGGAEALGGLFVGAPREAMPEPAADEYYWDDLIGLDVENAHAQHLGKVSGLLTTGAHDVLKVHDGKQERLLPFVAAVVLDVSIQARKIRVEWELDW